MANVAAAAKMNKVLSELQMKGDLFTRQMVMEKKRVDDLEEAIRQADDQIKKFRLKNKSGAVEVLKTAEESVGPKLELQNIMLAVCAFGERALSNEDGTSHAAKADATVRALRFCELSVLLRDDFFTLCELNSGLRDHLNSYVLGRARSPCESTA